MPILRIPLRVGEVLSATVRRKLTSKRVLLSLKGYTLIAEPEQDMMPGDEILVQVLSIFPRVRLRLMTSPPDAGRSRRNPSLDLRT